MNPVLEKWLAVVRGAELTAVGTQRDVAVANQQIFQVQEGDEQEVGEAELVAFLELAFREFTRKLAGSPLPLWFYAWTDEMSGTLRCSAAPADGPEKLPFGCELNVVDGPAPVAHEVLTCPTLQGIPFADLVPVSLGDADDRPAPEPFVLTVFVRQLPRLVET